MSNKNVLSFIPDSEKKEGIDPPTEISLLPDSNLDPSIGDAVTNIKLASGLDPDTEAKYNNLAQKAGMPVDVIRGQEKNIETSMQVVGLPKKLETRPGLKKYLNKQKNAAISKDDVNNLADIEDALPVIPRRGEDILRPYRPSFPEQVVERFEIGKRKMVRNVVSFVKGIAEQSAVEEAGFIERFLIGQKERKRKLSPEGVKEMEALSEWAEKALQQPELEIPDVRRAGTALEDYPLDVVEMAPQIISQILLAYFTKGITPVSRATSMGFMGTQIAGGQYEQLTELGVEDPVRKMEAALLNATFQAPLEQIGLEKVMKFWKPGPGMNETFKNLVSMMGTEWLTESLQAYPESATTIWGRAQKEGMTPQQQVDKFFNDFADTTLQGMYEGLVAAPMSIFGAGVGVATSIESSRTFNEEQTEINEAVNNSATKERSPESIEEFMEDSGFTEESFLTPEGAEVLFQEDPEIFQRMGLDSNKVQEDINQGLDIRVKTSKLHSYLTPEEFSGILQDLKPSPGVLTAREIQDLDVNEEMERISKIYEDVHIDDIRNRESIDRLREQVIQAGYDTTYADTYIQALERMESRLSMEGAERVNLAEKIEIAQRRFEEQRADVEQYAQQFTEGQQYNQEGQIKTETPEFKNWFQESKVADEKGKPLVVYHGTDAEFRVFDTSIDMGSHFGTKQQGQFMADLYGGSVKPFYLNIKNPLRMHDTGFTDPDLMISINPPPELASLSEKEKKELKEGSIEDFKQKIKSLGFDGIVYSNTTMEGPGDSYIAFEPTQIKSVESKAFDPTDPDVYYQEAVEYTDEEIQGIMDTETPYTPEPTPSVTGFISFPETALQELNEYKAELAEREEEIDFEDPYIEERMAAKAKDEVSGYYKGEGRLPTVEKARDFVIEDPGTEAYYVEMDIRNLGGLNALLGHSGADTVFRKFTDLIAENLDQLPGDTKARFRHGGDEISAVTVGVPKADLENALWKAYEEIAVFTENYEYEGKKLSGILHAKAKWRAVVPGAILPKAIKELTKRGTGVNFGIGQISENLTASESIERADIQIEERKKGKDDEYRKQASKIESVTSKGEKVRPSLEKKGRRVRQEVEGRRRERRDTEDRRLKPPTTLYQRDIPINTPEFKDWFDDSQVVDEKGGPLVVYHGSPEKFDAFDPGKTGAGHDVEGAGFYFTNDKKEAEGYQRGEGGEVYEVYLNISNPVPLEGKINEDEIRKIVLASIGLTDESQIDEWFENNEDAFWESPLSNWAEDPYTAYEMQVESIMATDTTPHEAFQSVWYDVYGADNEAYMGAMLDLGYDGVIIKGEKQHKGNDHYIAFEPTQIKSVESRAFDPTKVSIYEQAEKAGPRGAVTITDEKYLVSLFENANLSTLLHETGHIYLEELKSVIDMGGATPQLQQDYDTVANWLEIQEGQEGLTKEQHEKFAKGFEAYLMEGKAPSLELEPAFARFRRWLTEIYKSVKNLNITLTDDVRGVFDRMFTADMEMDAAAKTNGILPKTTEEMDDMGILPEDQQYLKRLATQAVDNAESKLIEDRNRGRRKSVKKWRQEATEEVEATPVYQQIAELSGKGHPGLNRDQLINRYGKDVIQALPNQRMANKKGENLDTVAILYGYESADHMVQEYISTPPKAEAIKNYIDEKQAEHDAQFKAEDYILNTTEYADYLEGVSKYLEGSPIKAEEAPGKTKKGISRAAFKTFAKKTMGEKSVRDAVRHDRYIAAMKKASKEENQAVFAEDFGTAARANERMRLNYEMAGQAVRNRKDVEKIIRKAKRAGKSKTINLEYREGILSLIQQFNLANMAPQKPEDLTPMSKLLGEGEGDYDTGFPASDFLLNNIVSDYRDLSMNEMHELENAIDYLTGKGRDEFKAVLADGKTKVEDASREIAGEAEGLPAKKVYEKFSFIRKLTDNARSAMAMLDSLQFISIAMGGYSNVGAKGKRSLSEEYILDPIIKAQNDQDVLFDKTYDDIEPYLSQMHSSIIAMRKKHGTKMHFPNTKVPQILQADGQTGWWTAEQVFSIALNMGNDGNVQRLFKGYPDLDKNTVENLLDLLTKEDWDAVQGIWDTIDSLYPDTDRVHTKLNNFRMEKVEPRNVITKYGEYKGGYYPAHFDTRLSTKIAEYNEKDDIMSRTEAIFQVPASKSGFTKQRAVGVSYPLNLSLDVAIKHIQDTVQYITHAEAVRDVDRITRHEDFKAEAERVLGKEVYNMIRPALKYVARPERVTVDVKTDRFVDWVRGKTTAFMLALNAGVAVKQLFATPASWFDLGVNDWAKGVISFLKAPSDNYRMMNELSPYIKGRGKSMDREMKDMFTKMKPGQKALMFGDKAVTWNDIRNFGFMPIRIMDMLTVAPIWHGAYNKAIKENDGDFEGAVRYADDIIRRTQETAQPLDLTHWQRASGVIRLFSSFQTYTVGKYGQRQRLHYRAWRAGKLSSSEYAWFNFCDALIPAIGMNLLFAVLWGKDFDDEETWKEMAQDTTLYWMFTGLPIIGQFFSKYGDPLDAPVAEIFNRIKRSITDSAKYIEDQSDKNMEKLLWDFAHIISFGTGVPVSKVAEKVAKGMDQQDEIIPGVKYFIPAPKK